VGEKIIRNKIKINKRTVKYDTSRIILTYSICMAEYR